MTTKKRPQKSRERTDGETGLREARRTASLARERVSRLKDDLSMAQITIERLLETADTDEWTIWAAEAAQLLRYLERKRI